MPRRAMSGTATNPPHRGFTALHGLVRALHPVMLLHGHVHPYGMPAEPTRLAHTMVRNVTGWHLLEIQPRGPQLGRVSRPRDPRPQRGGDAR